MKELDSFTVEEIEEIISSCQQEIHNTPTSDEFPVSPRVLLSLARIALAAKRAEPVAYGTLQKEFCDEERSLFTDKDSASKYSESCYTLTPLYTTPQLNSPEIPEDWIKFQEQKPIANQYISFVSRHGEYASGLVGEDEWVEMHDGTSFALDEIYIWLLLPPLPATPEKSL